LSIPLKILIIIQRSNGDVFLSIGLIKALYEFYDFPQIDLLVNDDTYQVAKLLPHINFIHRFSYIKKVENQWKQEKSLLIKLFRKYDLSINLTSSDRSVLYAVMSSKRSISVIEKDIKKSWWKKLLLNSFYYYDASKHILEQNYKPLRTLGINTDNILHSVVIKSEIRINIEEKLKKEGIKDFLIFHPSAQYYYKILPKKHRDELLAMLSRLGLSIIVTGSNNEIDTNIKRELPKLDNLFDFIGETSLEEYFALSQLSSAYIGMDTLNMHIAASQNKRVFAIYGPTNLKMWSPWSNKLQKSSDINMPLQTYGNISIFQANMPCVACGRAGCDGSGVSECLNNISPSMIYKEVKNWLKDNEL
jgi:heptosyltransferase III